MGLVGRAVCLHVSADDDHSSRIKGNKTRKAGTTQQTASLVRRDWLDLGLPKEIRSLSDNPCAQVVVARPINRITNHKYPHFVYIFIFVVVFWGPALLIFQTGMQTPTTTTAKMPSQVDKELQSGTQ